MSTRIDARLAELTKLTRTLNLQVPPSYFSSGTTYLPYQEAIAPQLASADAGPLHLYVGVPLCEEHCSFCMYFYGFADAAGTRSEQCVQGLDALLRALRPVSRQVAGMYVGGGTPSVLEAGQIERLLGSINATFGFEDGAQRTFEMSPKSMTDAKLRVVSRAGVHRVSFGIQSFDPEPVRLANREHVAPERVAELLRACHEAGIDEVNVDLMVGLVGEGPTSLADSVRHLLEIDCPTISIYRYRPALQREVVDAGGMDHYIRTCVERVEAAIDVATEFGYIPNGRSDGEHIRLGRADVEPPWEERNLYETRYRPRLANSLVGIGSGARSFDQDRRFVHCVHRPKGVFDLLDAAVEVEDCDPHSRLAAALVNELFRDFAVDVGPLERASGLKVAAEFADELDVLLDRGILEFSGSVLAVPEPARDQWVYWDKLLYPPSWLERRRKVDRPRVR